ncbi:MAG: bifunctional 4-hydroxy-2-oxoglutarate aldolase/2-dehydro-3-deoxy-phosphogluconate aldolase [Mangrovicoccus sp.]|nr:bifunctional 4-hydroxy-2-oxoglutarate aldolase/2-dehydro-3-deoxy-phosphogluconate aldolase [Mangrovicoccus sp.]
MSPEDASAELLEMAQLAPVIPVIVIHDLAHAKPLARALVAGGLPMLEVTLRSPAALPAIAEMAQVPGAIAGAGTVLAPSQLEQVAQAGGRFAVSPGSTPKLLDNAACQDLPLLPGAATASEAMALLERGYCLQKFFPAEASGGAQALGSFAAPLPQIQFCPTGGVSLDNAPAYLRLSNVTCVGGSWVAPKDLMAAGEWDQIAELAAKTVALLAPQRTA